MVVHQANCVTARLLQEEVESTMALLSTRLTCITAEQARDAAYLTCLSSGCYGGVVPEYEQQWGQIHPEPGRWNWAPTDTIVHEAAARGLRVEGHCLVWGTPDYPDLMPSWVTGGRWTRTSLLAALQDHISAVVNRYRAFVHTWRVVNEAIDDAGDRRDFVMQTVIGDDWIELAFRFAHCADPTAALIYNDYGLEWGALGGGNPKYDAVIAMAKSFRRRGIPMHGIGLQCHFDLRYPTLPDPADFPAVVASFRALGLDVQATELDIRVDRAGVDPARASYRQASVTALVCNTIDSAPGGSVCVWGLSDRTNWLGPAAAAAPYESHYRPKQMAYQLTSTARKAL